MTFPTIKFKYSDLSEGEALAELVDGKFSTLEKFIHDHDTVSCDVEFEKVAPHKNGQIHRVEVNLMLNGTLFRAEAVEENFEKAIDEVREELDVELRRAKGKQAALDKSAGREMKEQMLNSDL